MSLKKKYLVIILSLLYMAGCSGPIEYLFLDPGTNAADHVAILKNLPKDQSNIILYEVDGRRPHEKNSRGMAAQYGSPWSGQFIIHLKPGDHVLLCGYSQLMEASAGSGRQQTKSMVSVVAADRIKISFRAETGHHYLLKERHGADGWMPILVDVTDNKQIYPPKEKNHWKVEIKNEK